MPSSAYWNAVKINDINAQNKFFSDRTRREIESRPEVIYVTGGTAKSPIVEEWIRSNFGTIDIVVGDFFGSIASGLTTRAHRIYQ